MFKGISTSLMEIEGVLVHVWLGLQSFKKQNQEGTFFFVLTCSLVQGSGSRQTCVHYKNFTAVDNRKHDKVKVLPCEANNPAA